MTAAEITSLHIALLQALKAAGDVGRPEERLLTDARMAGFNALTVPTLQRELRALADRSLVNTFTPIAGLRYRITSLGNAQLDEAGL